MQTKVQIGESEYDVIYYFYYDYKPAVINTYADSCYGNESEFDIEIQSITPQPSLVDEFEIVNYLETDYLIFNECMGW